MRDFTISLISDAIFKTSKLNSEIKDAKRIKENVEKNLQEQGKWKNETFNVSKWPTFNTVVRLTFKNCVKNFNFAFRFLFFLFSSNLLRIK